MNSEPTRREPSQRDASVPQDPGPILSRRAHAALDWAATRLGPHGALIVLLGVGLLFAVLLSMVTEEIYDSVTDHDGVAGLDRPLLDFAIVIRTPVLNAIVAGFSEIAGPIGMPIIAVVAILVLALTRRSWTPVIIIAAAGLGSLAMTIVGKNFIGRVRPDLSEAVPPFESSPSFPSGHTLNAVVVIGAIAYLLVIRQTRRSSRYLTIGAAAVFAIAVGLSRVYLGHHWFTDVLAGWLLGLAWLALVITAHRVHLYLRRRRHAAVAPATDAP